MRHTDLLPEQECTGELISIEHPSAMTPGARQLMVCDVCGTQFRSVPGSDWVQVVYPGMQTKQ